MALQQFGDQAVTVTVRSGDTLQAGNGNDTIQGSGQSTGNDLSNVQATIGNGADSLLLNFTSLSTGANDSFTLGNGNDSVSLAASLSNSTITLGDGNENFFAFAANLTNDRLIFGNGVDSVQFSSSSTVSNSTMTFGNGNSNVLVFSPTATNDVITFGNGANFLQFAKVSGNDTINIGTGSDTLQFFAGSTGAITINQAKGGGPSQFDFFGSSGISATITVTNLADTILNTPNSLTVQVAVDGYKAPYSANVSYVATAEAIAAPYNIAQPLPYFIANLFPDPVPHQSATIGSRATAPVLQFSFMQKLPSYASATDAIGFTTFGADLPASVIGQSPQQILSAVASHAITLNSAELAAVTALASWQAVANVSYVAAADSDAVAIRFGMNTQSTSQTGYAYNPDSTDTNATNLSEGGDVYINKSAVDATFFSSGGFGATVTTHEIGHTLGFGGDSGEADPHDTMPGGLGSVPGGLSSPKSGEPSNTEDNLLNTVMTHNNFSVNNVFPNAPQSFDIAVVQYLYGPSPSYHPNASHLWSFSASGGNLVSDGPGFTNTVSAASATQSAYIDLRSGHWDYIGAQAADIFAANQLFIDYGTLVQVAIGGSGNDTLVGNDANDSLSAGAGNDLLVVGPGNDTLDGGTGSNTALFADARASYTISTASGVTTVTETVSGRQGSDVLSNIGTLQFSDQSVAVSTSQVSATVTAGANGTLPTFDATASLALDLTNLKAGQSISGLTGSDFITVGGAGVTITASSGNDQVLIPSTATGNTSFTGLAGNDSVTAAGGTNVLVGGTGSAAFSLTGGANTAFTGTGQTNITVTGGTSTIVANQGVATVADSSAHLLLGLLGGSDQISLNGSGAVVIAAGGASTITATTDAPLIGTFAGTHSITLGSGGGTVFSLGATASIQGGSGITGVDLLAGQVTVTAGSGFTELFGNGGSATLLVQGNAGSTIISGYDPTRIALDISHQIGGNNFTSAGQIPITHDSGGNVILNLGTQFILLSGTSSISASAITLV